MDLRLLVVGVFFAVVAYIAHDMQQRRRGDTDQDEDSEPYRPPYEPLNDLYGLGASRTVFTDPDRGIIGPSDADIEAANSQSDDLD